MLCNESGKNTAVARNKRLAGNSFGDEFLFIFRFLEKYQKQRQAGSPQLKFLSKRFAFALALKLLHM